MRIIWQTGTVITADNLNLSQLAYGSPGIISGCSVYESNNYLYVSSGIIKFEDGMVVYLDGTDFVDFSSVAHSQYYLYAIQYGTSIELSLSLTLPSNYEYVLLATIQITDSGTIITNETVSSSVKSEMSLFGNVLSQASYDSGISSITPSVNETLEFPYISIITASASSGGSLYIPFVMPKYAPTKFNIRGIMSSDTLIGISFLVGGVPTTFSNNKILYTSMTSIENEVSLSLGSILSSVNEGTLCAIKISISQISGGDEDTSADLQLYSIRLTNT